MVVPRGHATHGREPRIPDRPCCQRSKSRQIEIGEIISTSAFWDNQGHLASHLHLPLETSGEARLVRKVGGEQDAMKERMLEMEGLSPLSINKEAATMISLAPQLRQSRDMHQRSRACLPTHKQGSYSR